VVSFIASKGGIASSEQAIAKQVYRARRCKNPAYEGNRERNPATGYFNLGEVPSLTTEQLAEFQDFVRKRGGQTPPDPADDGVRARRSLPVGENGFPGLTLGGDEGIIKISSVSDLVRALIAAPAYHPNTDLSAMIPRGTGIYVWFAVQEDKMVYVGTATGRTGLYRRIMKQHLDPSYLLTDKSKSKPKDAFQAANPAISNGKPAIDKSAFRKNISRVHSLRPGHDSVDFIIRSFSVRFVCIQDRDTILAVERDILANYHPEYNISGNRGHCHPALR
jgi:hypothetical protein